MTRQTSITALEWISKPLAWLAMSLVVVLIGALAFEVVSRRLFNTPTLWAQDIATMANGVIFVTSGAFVLRAQAHIRIDFLASLFPPWVRSFIDMLFFALALFPVLCVIGFASANEAYEAWASNRVDWVSPWKPLMWPYLAGIALGIWVLALQALIEAVRFALDMADALIPPKESIGGLRASHPTPLT